MTMLPDSEAREMIRTALFDTLVVEAAAGTGKTTELVQRIVAVVAAGLTSVARIVAVTFTARAAGELKLRLRTALEEARAQTRMHDVRGRHLEEALIHLEEAWITTIHGFCADLLRERPIEARVDPEFRVMNDAEAERLYAQVFDVWLTQQLEDPPPGLRRALRREPGFHDQQSAHSRLRRNGWTLTAWRDFPAAWEIKEFDRDAAIDQLVEQLHELADLTERSTNPRFDGLYRTTARARQMSKSIRRAENVRDRDYDGLEAMLVSLARDKDFGSRKGGGFFFAPDLPRAEVENRMNALRSTLQGFQRAADAQLAALLHEDLTQTIDLYEKAKARLGCLDFLDLLLRVRDLLRDSADVRAELQSRFTHVFVDEFQDTDPLQAEILLLLCGEDRTVNHWREITPRPGKLFIVGDPKQSIYRFRRADVGVYEDVKKLLLERGGLCVQLTTSFRAVPSIQRLVNRAFAETMTAKPEALQAAYTPLTPYREDTHDQPTVVALSVPRPYGTNHIRQTAIEASLPHAVAAWIDWLLHHSGWSVTERERPTERVPIGARHICLLFRRFQSWGSDITRGYVRALEARGIRHLLVGGRSFHDREEIQTMRAALTAIEWPDDELSVYATLHGSLFAIGDEELFEYRQRYARLHPFRIPASARLPTLAGPLKPIVSALLLLRELHLQRNRRAVGDTITRLLEHTRAHAGFALRPSGEQALANVLHLSELARVYEEQGGLSFRGFVERLREEAGGAPTPEAPILEEGSDGVRIMTVHKAKGLEFPVVILADITAKSASAQADRHIDAERGLCAIRLDGCSPHELLANADLEHSRDEAEGVRIAYVAATRARDLLVIPAVGDLPFERGWVSAFNGAIYPPEDSRQKAQSAPRCPLFGPRTVLERPDGIQPQTLPMRPGQHDFDGYNVVWWDPCVLELDSEENFGIRKQELIGREVDSQVVNADLAAYRSWRAERDIILQRASEPTIQVARVTENLFEVKGAEKIPVLEVERDPERPGGKRFGSLVHAVLASVPLRASGSALRQIAEVQARILGATEEEATAAVVAVERALAHPLLTRARRAAANGLCRRETPVTLRTAEGQVVDGVVDLAFREEEIWTVVDFKTDRELAVSLSDYQQQVALYAAAIQHATGEPATGVLLCI